LIGGAAAARRPRIEPRRLGRRVVWLGLATAATAAVLAVVLPARGPDTPPAPVAVAGSTRSVSPPPSALPSASPSARELATVASQWIGAAPLHDELAALESDTLRGTRAALRLALVATSHDDR
jgi:hypothetical protein